MVRKSLALAVAIVAGAVALPDALQRRLDAMDVQPSLMVGGPGGRVIRHAKSAVGMNRPYQSGGVDGVSTELETAACCAKCLLNLLRMRYAWLLGVQCIL